MVHNYIHIFVEKVLGFLLILIYQTHSSFQQATHGYGPIANSDEDPPLPGVSDLGESWW